MCVKKNKIDNKALGLPSLQGLQGMGAAALNVVPGLALNPMKKYFCIRNGVLYQYERKTAREAVDRFRIGNIGALDLKTENDVTTIRMIYKKFYVLLTIDTPVLGRKWLNSLQYVKDNND